MCPFVDSGAWTAGIARRAEAQIQADWMAIPALRNVDFRYSMYTTPHLKFQSAIETADSKAAKAREYADAACGLYDHLWNGYQITASGRKRRINGDITKLRFARGLTKAQKHLLREMGFVAQKLSGTQELRVDFGHMLWGANSMYGLPVFITVSPSPRHSGLCLKLFRKRLNDPYLKYGDPELKEVLRGLAVVETPAIETAASEDCVTIELPEYKLRRQALSNDVLCTVDAFIILVKVVLATLVGIRMCPKCPACNAPGSEHPCQDQFGSNMELMGGIFGGAEGFGGAVESQRAGPLHLHLLLYLVNAFQHKTMKEIGELLKAKLLSVAAMARYLEWVSMHDNIDEDYNEANVDEIEQEWEEEIRGPSS